MVSLFALYRRPQDEAEFLEHYENTHIPLALQMPGLLGIDWGHEGTLGSEPDGSWFLVAEMRFSNKETLMAALDSPEGKAAAADLRSFAKGLVSMRMVEWR